VHGLLLSSILCGIPIPEKLLGFAEPSVLGTSKPRHRRPKGDLEALARVDFGGPLVLPLIAEVLDRERRRSKLGAVDHAPAV
jgi:hypothetical protein